MTVAVIGAGAEKIGQYVVAVGGTNQTADRQPHQLCDVGGKNVAEVAGRHADVDLFTGHDRALRKQVAVCRNVVDDLRCKSAPVDGVCTGQEHAFFVQLLCNGRIRENLLHAGLCVVKVAADRADIDVCAGLRCHLQLLHAADTVHGVEDFDSDAVHVAVAFKRGFAGVARGGDEDHRIALFPGFIQRAAEQTRHQLERHVLEGAGRSVPELERIDAVIHFNERRCTAGEFHLSVCSFAVAAKFLFGIICEKFREHIYGSFDVGFVFQHQNLILRECGDLLRHKESAACGKSLFDCLCCRNAVCSICAARACVLHGSFFSRLKHSF